jgi:transcriptional regulator GlxA family with amidase domain
MVNREDAVLQSPLVLQELQDNYLTQFVLAAQAESGPVGKPIPVTVIRRAEEFLAAHLSVPLSRAQLAEVAGFSIRTLSREFVKKHGMGPMTFLKQRRLEAAYRELLGADKGSGVVTKVAMRFGFSHLGKFAIAYRQAFGECPSQTLKR